VFKPYLAFLLLLTTSQASAQEDANVSRKVAVLDAVKFNATRSSRNLREKERFDTGFERTLGSAGWTAVPVPGETCSSGPDCLPAVSQHVGVGYVLRITGEGNAQYGYRLNIELFSAVTKQTQKGAAFCDICNADRVAEIAGRFAIEQLTAVTKEERPKEQPLPLPAPAPETTPNLVSPPQVSEPSRISWIPWTMIGAGALAMGYGAWALYENGHSAGSPHLAGARVQHDHYSSITLGIATMAAGGVLATLGTFWVLATPSSSHVSVSLRF
jgi:hypothetical protein